YATDWEGAELIAGNIPAAQTEYMDYSWAAADYGVYNWGVFAYYESAPTAIYSSNCLDKDMITEVDVTVTLNSGEAATGTVVTFTNTSEPDLELEYEVTLDATGKFTWDEFRKGTYDISVVNEWFANVTETDVLIEEEESFVWQLVENIDAPTDLYVTPTAYASWEGSVPGMKDILVTIGEGTATGYDLPMNTFWNFSYNQQIFDADEIGYNEGTIFSVAFQYAYATSFSNDIKIFMANTTKNVFESTSDWVALSELTEVYSGNVTFVNTNEGNWVTIEFDTPFTYTGGNVVLATLDETTGYPGSTRTFYRHTTGGNKSLVSYRDSGGAINPAAPISTSYAYVRDYRNNVQFGINTRSRMAEQYKVFLNGVFVDNTMDPFYQYNVANLTVGEEYLSEVLVDYTTGQSAKAYYTFTYAGCDAYDAPTTLASVQSVGTKNAVLTWTNPDLSDVDYLRVYRNGAVHKNKLSMDTPFTTWTDPELANGTYNYALTLVYDDGAETCLDAATTAITIKSTGTINGTVTYKLGGNVQGATITVSNTNNTYTFTTAAAGTYTGTVEAGTYEVKCEFAGHISQTTNATVAYVGTTTVDFSLYETPVAVDNVLAWEENGAVTVSWDGSGPTPPPGEYCRIEVAANDVWGDGTGYIALLDEDAEFAPDFTGLLLYTEIPMSIFSKVEYTVPEGVTNLLATTPKVVTGSAYVDIPAGTYDYALLGPDQASGRIWTVGSGGPAAPIGDNFVFEANKKYTFTIARHGTGDGATLTVEDFSFKGVAMNIVYPKPVVSNNSPVEQVATEASSTKSIENVKELSAEEIAAFVTNNAVQTTDATRAIAGYEVYRNDCYDGEAELLASLPATAGTFTDNQWSGLDHGVYKWGVKAIYDLNASEMVYSNCIDKDMNTEVSVKVTLNTAENPEGTKVIFTNTSEPAMELVYEIVLDETGYFLFEEFRKGEYDITVNKTGYAPLELTEESIWEATDYVWVLDELTDPVLDLYVSPTGYATWGSAAAFEGFYENFDEGMPDTWTIESNGNAAAITWRGFFSGNNLNGTPFAEANAETYGAIANEKLYSPIIDASGASELYLSFIQVFKVYQDDKADLLVYDGSDWVSVYTTTTNAGAWGNPNAQEIDVTAYANKDFQICFHFYSDWGYYWAIDDVMLSETPAKDRAVQSYKIWLDGVFAADVVTPYYQHDVTNLVEDQEYTTEVAVVYTSGISEKESFTWTYKPCELYGGAVTFEAEVTGNQEVTLNWTLPGGTTPPPPGDDMVRIELAANNVWGDGSGYVMLLDADANMYPEMPAGNFGGTMPAAFFNEFEYTIPEGATNTFATPSVVTGSAYIDIPAGTYDYVIVNPDGSNTWVAGAAGNANSKADNYVFEANKKYTFTMIYDDILDNDGPNLTIEDFNFGKAIINMQPIKPIIASTGEKSYSYGSARRTADQNTPQVLYSTGDLSLLTSTAEKAAVVSKETRADVLYDNNVPVTTSGLITVYWAASDVLVQIADDFEGVAGWSIEQIVTNGFCNTSTIPTTYGIHFYADDNGKPGEELYSNINCQGVEGDVITITLPEAYVIPSDGKYWISIYGVRSTAQDFNTRFDIFTSTTAIGSKLYLKDHANLFQGGTEWQPVDPGLVAGVVSMTFSLLGVAGDPPVPPAVEPILGVNIYRDGELLAFVKESITEYVDKDVAYGEHEYCIRVVYES
ncbi:DUF2436 domain-containing protein, partial [Bacteroidales bacterium OttesenSCG-928-L14]|nr:DUF2436 domain-containing protein [Bacteroidales bacterium OttesenSCG-928-L14]